MPDKVHILLLAITDNKYKNELTTYKIAAYVCPIKNFVELSWIDSKFKTWDLAI